MAAKIAASVPELQLHPTVRDIPAVKGRNGMLPVAAVFAATSTGGIGLNGTVSRLDWPRDFE